MLLRKDCETTGFNQTLDDNYTHKGTDGAIYLTYSMCIPGIGSAHGHAFPSSTVSVPNQHVGVVSGQCATSEVIEEMYMTPT